MTAAAAQQWVLDLPWDAPPVKANGGYGNRYARAAKVREVRQTVGLLARRSGISRGLQKIRVQLVWYVPDRRRRDTDNLWGTLKPAADALAGGGGRGSTYDWPVVRDDTPEFMEKPEPRIVYRKGQRKRLVLVVTVLEIE